MGQDSTTDSRKAFHELLELLRQLDARYLGPRVG
jgi:hypothetical protein